VITLIGVLGVVVVLLRSRRRRSVSAHERADVGFMIAMHHALRRDMTDVEAQIEVLEDGKGRAELIERWGELRQRLGRHHTAEDNNLWPVLRPNLADPVDQRELDEMVDEHHRLDGLIAVADRALVSPDVEPQPMFAELGSALRDHLDHEERTVLPLVEQHLSRAEWRRFLVTERNQTPLRERPTFLGWVLDDAEDADREAVLGELPPPGRVVYRRVIGPRYRARHPRPRNLGRPRNVAVR
jgi:hemerythrin-like domain-containing protein